MTLKWQIGVLLVAVVGFGNTVSANEMIRACCPLKMSFVVAGILRQGNKHNAKNSERNFKPKTNRVAT